MQNAGFAWWSCQGKWWSVGVHWLGMLTDGLIARRLARRCALFGMKTLFDVFRKCALTSGLQQVVHKSRQVQNLSLGTLIYRSQLSQKLSHLKMSRIQTSIPSNTIFLPNLQCFSKERPSFSSSFGQPGSWVGGWQMCIAWHENVV